jgi:3,5-dihydroxyphenylacetyl-CoA synthase
MRVFALPKITAVGTGSSPDVYKQRELLDIFRIEDPRIRSIFLNSWIEHRHLNLPLFAPDGALPIESQGELIRKNSRVGLAMGVDAISRCLEQASLKPSDVDYLCCVSSTGFMTPGFSALLFNELGFRHSCSRLDIVGMGCNAGLNALSAVTAWASAHEEQVALLVCIEVCSAAYVFDGTTGTSVVNSLFGDGAAAISVVATKQETDGRYLMPSVTRFASCIIPSEINAMRYYWDDKHGKFSFFLDPEVPYVVGAHAGPVLRRLLDGTGLRPSAIKHWVVHAGGKKVIDSVRINLGLTKHDMRHTLSVLRDYGNVSSGSFLFSYERLVMENTVTAGDYGVMMTMGPGSTIEMALLHWN